MSCDNRTWRGLIGRLMKYTYSDKFRRFREPPELESDEVKRNCLDTKSKES